MMENNNQKKEICQIGFISIRFSGTDGVSLETEKWVKILESMGHECFFFAGISDWSSEKSWICPEANFKHPDIDEINQVAFTNQIRPRTITDKIQKIKEKIKSELHKFVKKFKVDILVAENALTIPMNIPLGLALTEFIAETGFPTIAHHHDFFWERKRFLSNCVWDYLNMCFPPRLPFIEHVVINSSGRNQLSLRTGASSTLIPNVMDFANPPGPPDEYTQNIRADLGVADNEYLFLQPTRVVPRKGIEHAIELAHRMKKEIKIVITHASGDEGYEYEQHLREYAELLNVNVNFESGIIDDTRGTTSGGRKIYSVWDAYPYADLITYPSTFEGFGNAFLESIYFKKPIVVNNYAIYSYDIRPKGFKVVEFEGFISQTTVDQVNQLLNSPELIEEMVDHNYKIAQKYYSYANLEKDLVSILNKIFGDHKPYIFQADFYPNFNKQK